MSEYSFELPCEYPINIVKVHDGVVINMPGHNRVRKFMDYITKEDPQWQKDFLPEAIHETVYPHLDSIVIEYIIECIVWNLLTNKPIIFLHGNKTFKVDEDGNLFTNSKRPQKFDLPNSVSFNREYFNVGNLTFC